MTGTVQTDRHFWLARSMARRLGVSFTAAMVEGRISAADLSLLVARCGVCAHAAACTDWLARSCASTGAAPGFCAIGAALDAIATVPPGRVEDSGGHENPV